MRRILVVPSFVLPLLALLIVAFLAPDPAAAQTTKKKPLPKGRPVKLRSRDGVEISAFYFGSNKGKEAIPVLLVHEWKGQKAPYGSLCVSLQKAGCAVLAFDYRGHGGSREITLPNGKTETFNLQTMNKQDVGAIVQFDIEAAKRFLREKNNEEELNLNALVVIGVREGCVLGATWAQADWRFPNVGSRKQGHDVKALVLVSPSRLLLGVQLEAALSDRNIAALPTLIIAGKGSDEESDAVRVHKRVGAVKRRLTGKKDAEGLTLLSVREPLGGPALVNESKQVIPEIVKFVTTEINISEVDNPWIERN